MKLLKNILDFYIRSSLHVAICFVALAIAVHKPYFNEDLNIEFYILQFCLVVSSYNFIKYYELTLKKDPFRFKIPILIVTFILSSLGFYLIIPEFSNIYPFILSAFLLVLIYALPIIFKKNGRSFALLKLPIIALCWTLLISSYLYSNQLVELKSVSQNFISNGPYNPYPILKLRELWLYVGLFFYVCALCISFEIRDIKYLESSGKTIAQFLGIGKTKRLGYVLLLLVFLNFNMYHGDAPLYLSMDFVSYYIILLITAIAIHFSDKFKSDYYASFFVEAIPLLWLALYLIF